MGRIISTANDPYRGYTAELAVSQRAILPGSNYTLTLIAPSPSTNREEFHLGRSGVTLSTLCHLISRPEYTGIARVTSLEFYEDGLRVNFLEGKHRPGSSGNLVEKTKVIPRRKFPKIKVNGNSF